MPNTTIEINLEATVAFSADELFPEGVPEGLSANDVVDLIRSEVHNPIGLIDQWGLEADILVTACVLNRSEDGAFEIDVKAVWT